MKRLTSLSHHVIQFCRVLRNDQFNIGPQEEKEALESLVHINWDEPDQFKLVLKSTLCKSFQHTLLFDDLYTQYWKDLNKAVDSKTKEVPEEKIKPSSQKKPSIEVIKNWLHGNRQDVEETSMAKSSTDEISGSVDLTTFHHTQFREWKAVINLIQRYVARMPGRRTVPDSRKGMVDFRTTLSRNMSLGGEMIRLSYRHQKENKTQLILLCDVSKSMELYSSFLIQMMYALQNSRLNIHTYVFSTRLYNISRKLKTADIQKSLKSVSDYVDQWSSGTKIGHCFQQFLDRYGDRYPKRKSFVFIVSDGWDGGDIELLSDSMQRLRKKAKKIIWINPLAKSQDFKPEVLGMKTCLPYIDYLVPALDAGDLKKYLSRMK